MNSSVTAARVTGTTDLAQLHELMRCPVRPYGKSDLIPEGKEVDLVVVSEGVGENHTGNTYLRVIGVGTSAPVRQALFALYRNGLEGNFMVTTVAGESILFEAFGPECLRLAALLKERLPSAVLC